MYRVFRSEWYDKKFAKLDIDLLEDITKGIRDILEVKIKEV